MAQQQVNDIELLEDAIEMLVEVGGQDVELVVEVDDVVQNVQDVAINAPMQQLNMAFNGMGKRF